MQLGMIGLGRMGSNMVRRLLRHGQECVVYDVHAAAADPLVKEGASSAASLEEFIAKLKPPRAIWLMVPAAVVDATIDKLAGRLERGDILIDGGNSYYHDDIRRAAALKSKGIHYVDVGTSGGVWGLERGYCMMIGGEVDVVRRLDPVFAALAPGMGTEPRTPGREKAGGTSEQGYLHCGPNGAGHFVKMVHNGIEYGLMAAYAEGFNILKHASVGKERAGRGCRDHAPPASRALPVRFEPRRHRRGLAPGSVIASWLLDLSAQALLHSPDLAEFSGRVSDSGEGRWTVAAAIDEGVPSPVLSAALFARFSSRGTDDYADKLLSAMRFAFGGHLEKKA